MTLGWQLAFVLLIVFVVLEGIAILALARAIGLMQIRLGPAPGPLHTGEGVALHSDAPVLTGFDLRLGRLVTFDLSLGRWGLLFVSPGCGSCRELARDAGRVETEDHWNARLVLIAHGTNDQNKVFAHFAPGLTVLSDPVGDAHALFKVESTPFAILVADGKVVAKGVVNHRDHLESLLEGQMTQAAADSWVRVAGPADVTA